MSTSNAIPGALRLKGASIEKSKKKKKKRSAAAAPGVEDPGATAEASDAAIAARQLDEVMLKEEGTEGTVARERAEMDALEREIATATAAAMRGKTEAERRYEERRRQRLEERMRKEGAKTHKERVQELNRYLAGLSEHHDMPRIGPG